MLASIFLIAAPAVGAGAYENCRLLSLHDVVGVTGVFTAKEPTYQVDAGDLHDALCYEADESRKLN